jgi:hypothetical protein
VAAGNEKPRGADSQKKRMGAATVRTQSAILATVGNQS